MNRNDSQKSQTSITKNSIENWRQHFENNEFEDEKHGNNDD